MIIVVIIGLLLSILIPNFLYKWILKGENRTLRNAEYVKTLLLASTIYMIPIITIQVTVDHMLGVDNYADLTTIGDSLFTSFIRASLLEEGTKYFFTYRLLKKHPNLGMKETVLFAGVIGIGHGILEKLVLGGPGLIINALFPGHMLFQWMMGYFIFKAMKAEGKERRKLFALSYLVPFVIHGFWDFGLYVGEVWLGKPGDLMAAAGAGMIGLMMVLYTIGLVKGSKRVKRIQNA